MRHSSAQISPHFTRPTQKWMVGAQSILPIPKNIDILLCEQDVQADDTKAIDAVLKADRKRWDLLDEEKRLTKRIEAGVWMRG